MTYSYWDGKIKADFKSWAWSQLTLEDETYEHVLPTKTSSQVQVKLLVLTKTLMPFESKSIYDVF